MRVKQVLPLFGTGVKPAARHRLAAREPHRFRSGDCRYTSWRRTKAAAYATVAGPAELACGAAGSRQVVLDGAESRSDERPPEAGSVIVQLRRCCSRAAGWGSRSAAGLAAKPPRSGGLRPPSRTNDGLTRGHTRLALVAARRHALLRQSRQPIEMSIFSAGPQHYASPALRRRLTLARVFSEKPAPRALPDPRRGRAAVAAHWERTDRRAVVDFLGSTDPRSPDRRPRRPVQYSFAHAAVRCRRG